VKKCLATGAPSERGVGYSPAEVQQERAWADVGVISVLVESSRGNI
jgi:hypothetical protein